MKVKTTFPMCRRTAGPGNMKDGKTPVLPNVTPRLLFPGHRTEVSAKV